MKNILPILGFVLLAGTSTASAGGCDKSMAGVAKELFESADTNKDGIMTMEEHDAAGLQGYGAAFALFDLNKDGTVSLVEYTSVFNSHHGMGSST